MKSEVVWMVIAAVGMFCSGMYFTVSPERAMFGGRAWDAAMGAAFAFNLGMFASNFFEWRERCDEEAYFAKQRDSLSFKSLPSGK